MSAKAFAPAMDLEHVTKVLLEFEGCPAVARKMLAEGLSHAVAQNADSDRHDFQARFLAETRNVLRDAHLNAVATQGASLECVQKAEAELVAQKSVSAETANVELAARAESQSKAQLVLEAQQQVVKADREHKDVEEATGRLCKERDVDKQEKAQHSAIVEGSLRMLLEGGWEDEEIKTAVIDAVQTHLVNCKVDAVLIAAATHALGTKPDSRHAFDKVTVDCIVDALEAKGKQYAEKLAEGEMAEQETRAHSLGMWAVADVARDAQRAAENFSEEADATLENGAAIAQVEAKKAADQTTSMIALQSQHAFASERSLRTHEAISAFERLTANNYSSTPELAEDVSMVDAANVPADSMEGIVTACSTEALPTGNPFQVPTPMVA